MDNKTLNLAKELSRRSLRDDGRCRQWNPTMIPTMEKIFLDRLKFAKSKMTIPSHQNLIVRNEEPSVFGVQFCENDPNFLISAHADAGVRAHDSRLQKQIWETVGHTECVNGATFIDENNFCTFSDDKTILIWDKRRYAHAYKRLIGHVDWVKNACYVKHSHQLVTSGLDHTIRTYDLKKPEELLVSPPSIYFHGLFRTKVDPEGQSLIITTSDTTVYKVDLLDLINMPDDAYRYFMSLRENNIPPTQSILPPPSVRAPLSSKRNRFSYIHYLPQNSQSVTVGLSVDMNMNQQCCLVRHGRTPSLASEEEPENTSNWLSLYCLDQKGTDNEDDEEEEDIEICHNPLTDTTDGSGNGILNFSAWHAVRLSWNVEDTLRHLGSSVRQRLNMLFSSWNEPNVEYPGRRQPQDIRDAVYYRDCEAYATGIIKEPAFSTKGDFILNPIMNGFEILTFGDEFRGEKGERGEDQENDAKQLKVHGQYFCPTKSTCVTVRASPDNFTVVAGDIEGKVNWFDPMRG